MRANKLSSSQKKVEEAKNQKDEEEEEYDEEEEEEEDDDEDEIPQNSKISKEQIVSSKIVNEKEKVNEIKSNMPNSSIKDIYKTKNLSNQKKFLPLFYFSV